MQEKRLKVWKRVTALVMSAILVAVSLPLALAAPLSPGTYDPVPVFEDDSLLWAWRTEEGTVQVSVPQAAVAETTAVWTAQKTIARYIVRLYDLGAITQHHLDPSTQEVDTAEKVLTASEATALANGAVFDVEFTAQDLQEAGVTLNSSNRYSVEVYAQDSAGWVSSPISTLVSDVPRFEYNAEAYKPVQENSTGMREVLMFEARNNNDTAYVSTSGNSGNIGQRVEDEGTAWGRASRWADGALDYVASSSTGTNQLDFRGQALYGGEDGTGAYQFYVTGMGDQSFATTWSRQHWILTDAEEVWFWFDLSQVSVEGLAFELKTQGKRYEEYYWSDMANEGITYLYGSANDDWYSSVTYSTAGTVYAGYDRETYGDPYVYLQTDAGSWEKVMLENGRIDLANYKGYIRVPIEFMCSTTDTYAEARNDNWGFGGNGMANDIGNNNEAAKKAQFDDNVLLNERALIDRAGTPISSALLLQYRQLSIDVQTDGFLHFNSSADGSNGDPNNEVYTMPSDYSAEYGNLERPYWGASMLAVGYGDKNSDGYVTGLDQNTSDPKRAYIELDSSGNVVKEADGSASIINREGGYKAIDDICGAGFSYTSMSADSVNKSFYLDSVMAYKSSGSYLEDMADDPGQPLENYYDQRTEIPHRILEQIDALITTPDLGDYRAVQYIAEMIDAYRTGYAGFYPDNSGFPTDGDIESAAASLGMSNVWQKYLEARRLCVEAGTIIQNDDGTYSYSGNNAANAPLVAELARRLEKLPEASSVSMVTDAITEEITELYQIYRRLNLAQLDALGYAEEEKLLAYIRLVYSASTGELAVVGDQLARNRFITFNDFEENVSLGNESVLLENDPGGYGRRLDYRYTQGFLTYGITGRDFMGTWDNYAVDGGDYRDPMQNGTMDTPSDLMENAVIGRIAANGFGGTNAAAVTINRAHYNGGNNGNGEYSILSVSRDSYTAVGSDDVVWGDAVAHALGDDVNLAAAAEGSTGNWSDDFPLGLVFYVDFSQLQNFKLTATITTNYHGNGAGPNDFILAMGDSGADKKFFLMDMESGEWVDVTSTGHGQNYFNSTTVGANGMKLDGYRGFIMIPLYQFKDDFDQGGYAVKMSECPQALNSIVRVNIGVAPLNDAAADTLTGHTFVVDNIGFGYAETGYNTGATAHPTFEETFGVKSNAAQDFEEGVAALEPMAEISTEAQAQIGALYTAYNALTAYQQSLPTVQQAKAQLDLCNSYQTSENRPSVRPVDEFMTFVNALDEKAKNAQTSGMDGSTDLDLPYPGVLDLLDATGAAGQDGIADTPNYAAYGLTAELVDQILEWREDFNLYTADQRAAMNGLDTAYLNAYRAAQRCRMLESFIDQGEAFMGGLFGSENALYQTMSLIYPSKGDADLGKVDGAVYPYDESKPYGTWTDADGALANEGYFVSISPENRGTLRSLYTTQYSDNMCYYAKDLLATGEFVQVDGASIDEVPMAVRNLLNNSDQSFQNGDVQPGLLGLQAHYNELYSDAKQKLESNAFTATDRETLVQAINEYENLIPTYHDVAELYDVIQQMYDLFPVMNSALDSDAATTPSNSAYALAVKLEYDGSNTPSSTFTYELSDLQSYLNANDAEQVTLLSMTSGDGYTLCAADGTQVLPYTLTAEENGVANLSGDTIEFTVSVANPSLYSETLSDTVDLTFAYTYTDRNDIKRQVTETKTVEIIYETTAEEFYSVSIPAEIVEIPWGETGAVALHSTTDLNDNGYSVDYVLLDGSSLTVDAQALNDGEMISENTEDTLTFTLASAEKTFTGPGAATNATADAPMQIQISDWDVAHDTYTGTIQYEITFNGADTTTP